MICPKCDQTVNACAPHGQVPATFQVEWNRGTLSFNCSHCEAKLEAEFTITDLREA